MDTLQLAPGATVDRLRLVASHIPERMPFDTDDTPAVVWWQCVCKCGSETTTTERKLLAGEATACYDCMHNSLKGKNHRKTKTAAANGMAKVNGEYIDNVTDYTPKVGDKFGELTLTEPAESGRWVMTCECGNVLTLRLKTVTARTRAIRRCADCSEKMAEKELGIVSVTD